MDRPDRLWRPRDRQGVRADAQFLAPQDGRGFKASKRSPFSKLPLHCCSLSQQPFESPVATREGAIFETANILLYVKRFGKNPVTGMPAHGNLLMTRGCVGGKLEAKELIPLRFHRNGEGRLHCPVTSKVFTNYSHVVMSAVSGHVYSMHLSARKKQMSENKLGILRDFL
eukprot:1113293-Amphidinium_carterae.1